MRFTIEDFSTTSIEDVTQRGYKKAGGSKLRNEDYYFYKHCKVEGTGDEKVIGYTLALLVYDWSKYERHTDPEKISVGMEFILGNNPYVSRFDLSVSDEKIRVEQFEELCEKLYNGFCQEHLFKNLEPHL